MLINVFILFFANLPANADAHIDVAKFDRIVKDFSSYASPLLATEGARLKLIAVWDQELRPLSQGGAGGASASGGRASKVAGVSVVGGLARHPLITADAFRFALCHELGHFYQGLSNEFGADGFAAERCSPALSATDLEPIEAGEGFEEIDHRCEAANPNSDTGMKACMRAVRAAWSIAQYSEFLWSQLRPHEKRLPLSFETTEAELKGKSDVPSCRLLHLTSIALGGAPPDKCM